MANRMLPLVQPITKDLVRHWKKIQRVSERLDKATSAKRRDLLEQIEKLTNKLSQNVGELESLGCIIDSYEEGIVDFRSEIEGEEVRLCWSLGEKEILYYHKPGETQRKRLLLKERLE